MSGFECVQILRVFESQVWILIFHLCPFFWIAFSSCCTKKIKTNKQKRPSWTTCEEIVQVFSKLRKNYNYNLKLHCQLFIFYTPNIGFISCEDRRLQHLCYSCYHFYYVKGKREVNLNRVDLSALSLCFCAIDSVWKRHRNSENKEVWRSPGNTLPHYSSSFHFFPESLFGFLCFGKNDRMNICIKLNTGMIIYSPIKKRKNHSSF